MVFILKTFYFLANLFLWFILAGIFTQNKPLAYAAVGGGIMFLLCFFYFYKFFFKTGAMTFFSTNWDFFKKRLKWSNSIAFTTALILFFILLGVKQ